MDTNTPITIATHTGGANGYDLNGCSFQETEADSGEFLFYAPNGFPIPTDPEKVKSGTNFTFEYAHLFWSRPGFWISGTQGTVSGSWTASDKPLAPLPNPSIHNDDPETGTFQSQGGPSPIDDDDLEASKSASA